MAQKYEMTRVVHTPIRGKGRIQKAKSRTGELYWVVNMNTWDAATKTATEVPQFKVAVENAPAYLKPGLDWQLTVASDKSKILSGVPDTAIVTAVFKEIVHAKDQPPSPKVQASSFKPTEPWATFAVIYVVTDGEFEGVEIVDFLNYNFTYVEDTVKGKLVKITALEGNGKSTQALAERLEALGIGEFGPIAWDGPAVTWAGSKTKWVNILPKLAQRARKAAEELDRKVRITLAAGKIVQIAAVTEADAVWEDDEDVVEEPVKTPDATDELGQVDNNPESETLPDEDDIEWGIEE